MSYREHPPAHELAPWLECIWERVGDGVPVRVLPDGCIDIVWTEGAATQLVGPNTRAFVVPVRPGAHVAGARFRPGGAPALLGVTAEALRDVQIAIEDVWTDDGARLAAMLDSQSDVVGVLRAWLLSRSGRAKQPDQLVRAAVTALELNCGAPASVRQLADRLGVSERHLRRRVDAAVGYGPKRLARIFRLRRALDAARGGEELARVAFDFGYADQAHFANECRTLAGATPSTMLAA